jgi:copper transporter 1
MFAGSCIGVVLLVMSLEFLRRASKEYDQYILLQAQKKYQEAISDAATSPAKPSSGSDNAPIIAPTALLNFRPNVLQQAIRAGLHMVQFAVAYFIMLLAMYYNGYIIISIVVGAYLGAFVFSWETIKLG